jgi:hypothetical protein
MSFESGSVSFRAFYLGQPLPRNHIEKFASRAAPSLKALHEEPIRGWVTGRHLLDNRIEKDTAYYAGYLRLTLMKAERKIPESLLRAECRMEELVRMQAEGRAEIDRRTRSEIRKEISDRLLPAMPPQLQGMGFIHVPETEIVYVEALSDKQIDALDVSMRETFGFGLIPVTPANAAAHRLKLDIRDLPPASFSPDCEDSAVGESIGQDFLTWLWFCSETRGGMMRLEAGEFAVMVEGPLTFAMEGEGAHEAVLRRGTPELSAEAKIALLSGKKLRRSRILIARGTETWQTTLDADQFTFRGLKLPEGEKLDAISRFQARMTMIKTFLDAFYGMYDRFLKERNDPKLWAATQKQIHMWVTDRAARR